MTNSISKKEFYKRVLLLAIPIALQNLLTALLNIFDQMMVGWLPAGIADAGLSAVLLANQVVFIYQIFIFAIANTVNIFIAQYTENKNSHLIKNRAGFGFIIILIVSVIFTVICSTMPDVVIGLFNPGEEYRVMAQEFLRLVSFSFVPMGFTVGITFMLRAIRKLKGALIVNICAVALNFLLNYTFMFGLFGVQPMGLYGAAVGTIISRIVEFIAITIVLFCSKTPIVGKPKEMFAFDKTYVKKFFAMFFPILCNEVFWVLATTVYLFVYDKLENSTVVLASVNIAQSLDKIVSVIMIGVGNAVGVVMGNIVGLGDKNEVQKYARESVKFGILTGLVVTLLTFVASFFAPAVFKNVTEETQEMSRGLIWLYALTAVIRTLNFMYVIGILRSGGDTTFCMVSETIILWVFSVPLVIVFGIVFKASLYVVFLMSMVSEVIKIIAFDIRIRKGKWIKFLENK